PDSAEPLWKCYGYCKYRKLPCKRQSRLYYRSDNSRQRRYVHGIIAVILLKGGEREMANFDKVKDIIVDKLGIDEEKVTKDASFKDDLGADSLDIAELVMELEDEFEMDIPVEEAEKILTVGDALDYIDKLEN